MPRERKKGRGAPTPAPTFDITKVTLIPLREAAQYIPSCKRNKNLGNTLLYRWANHGISTKHNGTVVLETRKIGGGRYTTVQWINEFIAATQPPPKTALESDPPPVEPPPLFAQDAAEAALDAHQV